MDCTLIIKIRRISRSRLVVTLIFMVHLVFLGDHENFAEECVTWTFSLEVLQSCINSEKTLYKILFIVMIQRLM